MNSSLIIFTLFAALLLVVNEAHNGSGHKKECPNKYEEKTKATTPTPKVTILTQCVPKMCNNASKPFCSCGIDNGHYSMPESGNCDDVKNHLTVPPYYYRFGFNCRKMRTVCKCLDRKCSCNEENVAGQPKTQPPLGHKTTTPTPAKCGSKTCNNESKPFCSCGVDNGHYSMPESGNCDDVIKYLTVPPYYYRFGFYCIKMQTICRCVDRTCNCYKKNVV